MNLALPALVVFILLLPGFLARQRFKYVERTSLDYSPFGKVVIEATLTALALHAIWIGLADLLAGRVFRLDLLLDLLTNDAARHGEAIAAIAREAASTAAYFATLYAAAFLLPWALRSLITRLGWDRLHSPLSRVFRFDAPWYYLLTGRDFAQGDEPDLIRIAAVVDVAGAPTLFMGYLDDFFVDADGTLNRLVLTDVLRRPFERDKTGAQQAEEERFYPVDGDYFVLRYSEIVTLNIMYIRFIVENAAPAAQGS